MVADRADGTARILAILFPLAGALRANRQLLVRRPEVDGRVPAFRDVEIAHWQGALEGSPSLGPVIDQIHEQESARAAAVASTSQRGLATAAIVLAILVSTVARNGETLGGSPWLVIAAAYAFAALFGAVRATRLDRRLHVELDALGDPIAAATATRGEAACGVLLVAVRARRAAAVLHNRVVAQAATNLADATFASLRNAFVALALWMVLDVAPGALTEIVRGWGSLRTAQLALAAGATLVLARR